MPTIQQKRMTQLAEVLAPVIERIVEAKLRETKIPDAKQWFTIADCANHLSVSEDHIRRWIDDGTLDARSISLSLANEAQRKHLRITRASLVALLNDERRRVV